MEKFIAGSLGTCENQVRMHFFLPITVQFSNLSHIIFCLPPTRLAVVEEILQSNCLLKKQVENVDYDMSYLINICRVEIKRYRNIIEEKGASSGYRYIIKDAASCHPKCGAVSTDLNFYSRLARWFRLKIKLHSEATGTTYFVENESKVIKSVIPVSQANAPGSYAFLKTMRALVESGNGMCQW